MLSSPSTVLTPRRAAGPKGAAGHILAALAQLAAAGEYAPSYARIAQQSGYSIATIQRIIPQLAADFWISYTPGGHSRPHAYRLIASERRSILLAARWCGLIE